MLNAGILGLTATFAPSAKEPSWVVALLLLFSLSLSIVKFCQFTHPGRYEEFREWILKRILNGIEQERAKCFIERFCFWLGFLAAITFCGGFLLLVWHKLFS